ncbi:hypothetical protein C8J56DRAFT_1013503 [Mycena floridula]|nr:hypothetical protein C8J56DRAFT_1013503 [Mycena floridula]
MSPVATSTSVAPCHTQVLVIGGGPSGSYAASVLAREGIQVTVIEAASFPRYHIGESMLPSVRPFLRFIDAESKVAAHGFTVKPGAAVKFNQWKREGYTDFVALNPQNGSWNVIRSEFDEILLRHAQESGALVYENHKVTSLDFDGARPTHAKITNGATGMESTISFDYLIDASGRNGIMSTKYLKNRKMNESLKNIACWGYWTGTQMYRPGTSRENAPWFEALTDESGWAWFIPLHNDTVSVGVVMDLAISTSKKSKDVGCSLESHYLGQLDLVPGLQKLLVGATLKRESGTSPIRSASDFSYSAAAYSGDHFRLVGDASAFIDPFFSSGVHLALSGGFIAGVTIAASIRGHCTELQASAFHHAKIGESYTRFLLVVLGAYKQIRAQELPVLSDVNEDNFDRAFDLIRPIIQGTADVSKAVTEHELTRTMDFVTHVLVTPTDPEMHEAVKARLPDDLLSPKGPILMEEDINKVLVAEDIEAKHVLREINARKIVHAMYDGPAHLESGSINSLRVISKRGFLGLAKCSE